MCARLDRTVERQLHGPFVVFVAWQNDVVRNTTADLRLVDDDCLAAFITQFGRSYLQAHIAGCLYESPRCGVNLDNRKERGHKYRYIGQPPGGGVVECSLCCKTGRHLGLFLERHLDEKVFGRDVISHAGFDGQGEVQVERGREGVGAIERDGEGAIQVDERHFLVAADTAFHLVETGHATIPLAVLVGAEPLYADKPVEHLSEVFDRIALHEIETLTVIEIIGYVGIYFYLPHFSDEGA